MQNINSCVPESETAEPPLQQLVHHKKVHSCHNQVRNKFCIEQILISGYMYNIFLFASLGKPSFKKKRNFMKLFHKRGGRVNRISYLLFRNVKALKNERKNQNKDFIKAVRGGRGSPFYEKFS